MTPMFANSAWVKTSERMVLRGGRRRKLDLCVRYGVFVHPTAGLTLIDTGYGPQTTAGAHRSWVLKTYHWLIPSRLNPRGSIDITLGGLGYTTDDVKNVIITHFHADHVSELKRLSNARIIARKSAFNAVMTRGALANYRHGIFPELLPDGLIDRITDVEKLNSAALPFGLGHGRDIFGDGTVITVDLPGHAEGHFGLCFPRADPPLLYAVDAQWLVAALERVPRLASWIVAKNYGELKATAKIVAAFQKNGGDVVLCHDPARTPYDLDDFPDG